MILAERPDLAGRHRRLIFGKRIEVEFGPVRFDGLHAGASAAETAPPTA